MGPDVNHVPCQLGQQERLRDAARARLARTLRRRKDRQPISADEAAAVVSDATDVWAALRF